ncbi:hypothetical protein [Winogradskyella sp.]|uniref:hypothetical protein n=1 Tax=Winogradskyella sp. TaxID=1883156 RepID=UPI00261B5698|nr:hypothetical protein [Winogradskyella sp.]
MPLKAKYVLVLIAFCYYTISNSQIPDSQIRTEFEKLKAISKNNFDVYLQIVEKGEIASLKEEKKIVISRQQLNKFSNQLSQVSKKFIAQIILGHELAHQFQFNRYNNTIEMSNSQIRRMLLESQADVLSGYLFGYLLTYDITMGHLTAEDIDLDEFYKIFEVILDIGIEENALGTHPSKNDRLMSFRQGLVCGMAYYAIDEAKKHPEIVIAYYGSIEKYNQIVKETLEQMDYEFQKENIFMWSYRMAKRVLNYDPEVLSNIILINSPSTKNIKWHTSSDNPFVDFEFNYMNTSNATIYVELEVYTAHVDREDSDYSPFHKKVNASIHKFNLGPKGIKKIKGRLRWDGAENDPEGITLMKENQMPRIVFPSAYSQDSWIYCEYTDKTYNPETTEASIEYLAAAPVPEKNSYKLASNILRILRELKYSPNNTIIGIGDLIKIPNSNHSACHYNSPLQFDKDCKITVRKLIQRDQDLFLPLDFDNMELHFKYKPFKSRQRGLEKYNSIIKAFDMALKDHVKEEDKETYSLQEVFYSSKESNIDVALYRNSDNLWSLEIEIY